MDLEQLTDAELREHLARLERVHLIKKAREDFLLFCKLMMPTPDAPDDLNQSLFEVAKHHAALANALERVEKGEIPRLIVCMPPRHGKTQMISKYFGAWCEGRDPYRSFVFGTYNDEFAQDTGRDVKEVLMSQRFRDIFPGFKLREGAKAAGMMKTAAGGQLSFVGRGTALTGRGAHVLVIDDILKDAEEANSPTIREKCWQWFTKVAMTRLMKVGASVIIVMTRWNEDDLVGRLTDPKNPAFDPLVAKNWKIINLPAEAEINDPLQREPGEPLWPERFPIEFLHAQKQLDPLGYASLYQQRPSPEEGAFFKNTDIVTYGHGQLPPLDSMRLYASSDHAVGRDKKKHDANVFLIAGVCKNSYIWLIDCWWQRASAEIAVEKMIDMMEQYPLSLWWAEDGLITQSIGPFLLKRKLERGVAGCAVDTVHPTRNKEQRAQSIKGLMAMKRVLMPKAAPWFPQAKHELLQFPNGANDDFVDAISLMGLRIMQVISGRATQVEHKPKVRSWEWWKKEMAFQQKQREGIGSSW